jgi:hypothetical protein
MTLASWQALEEAVEEAGPDATAFVLRLRRTGLGHAVALHNVPRAPAPGGSIHRPSPADRCGRNHPATQRWMSGP